MDVAEPSDIIGQQTEPEPLSMSQRRVLAVFSTVGSVLRACRSAKIARDTHYRWLRESPLYKAGFEESQTHVARMLEDEAIRRAVQGETRAVRHRGKVVGWETTRSDGLLKFMLQANNPEKFSERTRLEHTGKNGAALIPLEAVGLMIRSAEEERDSAAKDIEQD